MKLNNRGMTLVELIISIGLLSIVLGFLFKILLDVRYESDNAGFAISNQTNRTEIIRSVQEDIMRIGVKNIILSSDKKSLVFELENNYSSELIISDDYSSVTYKSAQNMYENHTERIWKIKEDNYLYGNILTVDITDCMTKITIPVYDDINDDLNIDNIEIIVTYTSCN